MEPPRPQYPNPQGMDPRPQYPQGMDPRYPNPGMERVQRPPGYMSGPENSTPYDGTVMPQGQAGVRMPHQPPPVVSYRYGPTGYPPRGEDGSEIKVNRQLMPDPRISQGHGKPPANLRWVVNLDSFLCFVIVVLRN